MKKLDLKSIQIPKRKYVLYKGTIGKIADNLLNREFKATKPSEKWAMDVTEFKINDEKLYLSPIVDLFNGEIISYNLSRHPVFNQVVDMLENKGIRQSMSRKGNCLDNGCAKTFLVY